ncbi:MAG: hypothetical protein GY862_22310 [Gammaproteobacteria bacterium]|nr:hypothetical protein [Gammaproteobacteria bacterium]
MSKKQSAGINIGNVGNDLHTGGDVISGDKISNSQGDTSSLSGDFRGANLNIKSTLSNVTQTIGALPGADDFQKEELEKLIQQLNDTLQQFPAEKAEEAEAVAQTAQALMTTAAAEYPNQSMLNITAKGLLEAAKAVAGLVPATLKIAVKIVETIGDFTE